MANVSFVVQGVAQESNVNTLGDIVVAGRGDVEGLRAIITLPIQADFYHSLTLGVDHKHFDQDVTIAGKRVPTPVTYYSLGLNYSATWVLKGSITTANVGLTFAARELGSDRAARELGSDRAEYDLNRFRADGNFISVRGDISHQHDLPKGFQVLGKLQGQVADQPLVTVSSLPVVGWVPCVAIWKPKCCATTESRLP